MAAGPTRVVSSPVGFAPVPPIERTRLMAEARGGPRSFAEEHKAGLGDFWQVYRSQYDHLAQAMLAGLSQDSELIRAVQASPPAEVEAQRQAGQLRLKAAMEQGEWQTYFDHLRQDGERYAQMGVTFRGWYDLVGSSRPLLLSALFNAYGDDRARVERAIAAMDRFTDEVMATIGEGYLEAKQIIIRQHQEAIRELSTPVLQVRERLLILPIVGMLDSHRARQLTDQLLQHIRSHRGRVVVIDVTGVPTVDSMVANHLIQTADSARLMGARCIITGVSADIAQTLVRLGVDVGRFQTAGDLQSGIEEGNRLLGYKIVPIKSESSKRAAARADQPAQFA
jgi:rsbT co-antagonist protein RsbR